MPVALFVAPAAWRCCQLWLLEPRGRRDVAADSSADSGDATLMNLLDIQDDIRIAKTFIAVIYLTV